MKKILLIVDDEEIVYKALSVQFEHHEIEIISVLNGEDGLKAAFQHHPDLILLDIVMPKMDGLTMLSKLREDEWGKHARVIILSNVSNKKIIKEKVDDYLIKADWNVTDVAKRVKEMLEIS